jgi:hypothetical protein
VTSYGKRQRERQPDLSCGDVDRFLFHVSVTWTTTSLRPRKLLIGVRCVFLGGHILILFPMYVAYLPVMYNFFFELKSLNHHLKNSVSGPSGLEVHLCTCSTPVVGRSTFGTETVSAGGLSVHRVIYTHHQDSVVTMWRLVRSPMF